MTKHSIEKMTTTYINSNIYTFSYKYCLTTDKSGDERWNCDLPTEPRYKQHNPKHT